MALIYDFDMISGNPKPGIGAADAGRDADGADPDAGLQGGILALFRDPATVEAMQKAPQAVQDYLKAAHFGINTYHSGAPAGRYPAADEAARITVIQALTDNVARFDLPVADDAPPAPDAFHLPSFFAAVIEAEPLPPEATEAPPANAGDAAIEAILADVGAPAGPAAETADGLDMRPVDAPATAPDTSEMIPDDPLKALLLSELAFADDAPVLVAPQTDDASPVADAEADAAAVIPESAVIAQRPRFQVPRWLMAGGAVAVLGALVGTAMI